MQAVLRVKSIGLNLMCKRFLLKLLVETTIVHEIDLTKMINDALFNFQGNLISRYIYLNAFTYFYFKVFSDFEMDSRVVLSSATNKISLSLSKSENGYC